MQSISRAEILSTNDKSHLGHIAQSLCISHDHFVTFLQLFAVRSRSKMCYGPPTGCWSGQETVPEMVAVCSDQCTDSHIYESGLKGLSYGGGGDMGRELNGAGGRESSRASDGPLGTNPLSVYRVEVWRSYNLMPSSLPSPLSVKCLHSHFIYSLIYYTCPARTCLSLSYIFAKMLYIFTILPKPRYCLHRFPIHHHYHSSSDPIHHCPRHCS